MQQEYIAAVRSKIEADDRLAAAWLEGSFGRGTADRYADIDLHLLLAPADLEPFTANVERWLSTIQPVVLCTRLFDGRLVNVLTAAGLRVDLVLHSEASVTLDPSKTRVLITKGEHLLFASGTPPHISGNAELLQQQSNEFWRCIALLPSVVGRNELIAGWIGLSVETQILTDMIMTGYGIVRDRGVKNLNQFLPAELRESIEAALSMQGLSPATLAKAHLGLARIMQQHGRILAERHGYAYPSELETAVLRYVAAELVLLGIQASVDPPT
jgi:hypothetical protein